MFKMLKGLRNPKELSGLNRKSHFTLLHVPSQMIQMGSGTVSEGLRKSNWVRYLTMKVFQFFMHFE